MIFFFFCKKEKRKQSRYDQSADSYLKLYLSSQGLKVFRQLTEMKWEAKSSSFPSYFKKNETDERSAVDIRYKSQS